MSPLSDILCIPGCHRPLQTAFLQQCILEFPVRKIDRFAMLSSAELTLSLSPLPAAHERGPGLHLTTTSRKWELDA